MAILGGIKESYRALEWMHFGVDSTFLITFRKKLHVVSCSSTDGSHRVDLVRSGLSVDSGVHGFVGQATRREIHRGRLCAPGEAWWRHVTAYFRRFLPV